MRDEREILTRALVIKKLKYEAQRSMVSAALIFFVGMILFGMLYLSFSSPAAKISVAVFYAVPAIVCVISLIRGVLQLGKISRGEFTVSEDVLTEIEDNQLSIRQLLLYGGWHSLMGNKSHLRHVFQFQSGRKFIANAEEYKNARLGTAAEFSMPGDTFFLVSYNDSPDKIVLLFSGKIYVNKSDR